MGLELMQSDRREKLYFHPAVGEVLSLFSWMWTALDWMFIPSKIYMLKPNPHSVGIWRQEFREVIRSWGWHLHEEDQGPEEIPESSLAPSAVWDYSRKMAAYDPGSVLSPDTKSVSTLILPFFQLLELWEKKCLLFMHYQVYGIIL